MKYAALVYQGGIANVFEVDALILDAPEVRTARRLLQGSFHECEAFARGLQAAGVMVKTAHCNRAGDIANSDWDADLDNAPFSESFRPVSGALTRIA